MKSTSVVASFASPRRKVTAAVARRIFKRDRATCVYCGRAAAHVDHVIPFAAGGMMRDENLVAACSFCNIRARDLVFASIEEKRAYLLGFERKHERYETRKWSLCGDCGYPFAPGVDGATNVLCAECARVDEMGGSDV